jgi:hypothetical protein
MPYAFVRDVPIDDGTYALVKEEIGSTPPPGMVVHLAVRRPEGGLRYIDVWDHQSAFERFHAERVEPAVSTVLARTGIVPDPSLSRSDDLDVIDVWLGEGARIP